MEPRKRILVTGAAGFIGFHISKFFKQKGDFCLGFDHFNHYYDPQLKRDRAAILEHLGVEVLEADLCERNLIRRLLEEHKITHVVHLAAQAGVRHSLTHPDEYVSSNLEGFVSLLEALRIDPTIRLIFASSSSVYGLNKKTPFSVEDKTDAPANLYGATKKANELIAHAYHHLYGMPITALRFFTVYGPWGRPDMAYYRFARSICDGVPIQVYNHGAMKRDFTYIDDIIMGVAAALDLGAPFEIFNLGNHQPVDLLYLIQLLEEALGKQAIKEMLPMQKGEVLETYADIEKSRQMLQFHPSTSIETGIARFIDWFTQYHGPHRQNEMPLPTRSTCSK